MKFEIKKIGSIIEEVNLKNSKYRDDKSPLDSNCTLRNLNLYSKTQNILILLKTQCLLLRTNQEEPLIDQD